MGRPDHDAVPVTLGWKPWLLALAAPDK